MIQTLLAEGYAPVRIKELLHTTYFRIRRYATGDPLMLCKFEGDRVPEADRYRDEIINLLTQNVSLKQALVRISDLGYQGKRTAFEAYCRKIIAEQEIQYRPRRNVAGAAIIRSAKPVQHHVSKTDFIRYLWSGKELKETDIDFICAKYPKVTEIQQCIVDFRKIFAEK